MRKELTEQYVDILQDWLPKEASLAIAINGSYVYYSPGVHDIQIVAGQPVEAGSIAQEVLNKKCKYERYIDKGVYGFSYYGIGYPVMFEEKEGAVVIILPPTSHLLNKQPLDFLTGRSEDCWFPVAVDKISHIESFQKKTWFYKTNESYQTIYTLKDLVDQLPNYFLRIHRSYIVNIQHILEISRDFSSNMMITLKNGTVLPVSQSYSAKVRKTLGF